MIGLIWVQSSIDEIHWDNFLLMGFSEGEPSMDEIHKEILLLMGYSGGEPSFDGVY